MKLSLVPELDGHLSNVAAIGLPDLIGRSAPASGSACLRREKTREAERQLRRFENQRGRRVETAAKTLVEWLQRCSLPRQQKLLQDLGKHSSSALHRKAQFVDVGSWQRCRRGCSLKQPTSIGRRERTWRAIKIRYCISKCLFSCVLARFRAEPRATGADQAQSETLPNAN